MLRRSVKWWCKLFFHLFSVTLNNAYVLYRKYAVKPVQHEVFIEHMIGYLVTKGLKTASKPHRQRGLVIATNPGKNWLSGRHFPAHIPAQLNIKRAKPSKLSHACNFGKKDVELLGYPGQKYQTN